MKRNKPSLDISKRSAIRSPLLKSSLLCNYVLVRFSCSSGDIRDSDALSSSNLSRFIPRLQRSSIVRPPYQRHLRVQIENVRRKFLRLADRNMTGPMRRSTTTSTRVCCLVFKIVSLQRRRLTFDVLFAHKIYNNALSLVLKIVSTFGLIASVSDRTQLRFLLRERQYSEHRTLHDQFEFCETRFFRIIVLIILQRLSTIVSASLYTKRVSYSLATTNT